MTKEIMNVASDEQLAVLAQAFPQEPSFTRILAPRFGMASQDQTEEVGKGKEKKINVIAAAGTFYTERESDEVVVGEDGSEKKVWRKEWLDNEHPEVIILYQRKQLRYYDEGEQKYVSSPIFDTDDEQVVLFKDRKEVARGTVSELKALYPGVDKKGKAVSKLKDEKVLYVLMDGELYQMNLHGSSLWSFSAYARKVAPPTVVTMLGSEHNENGQVSWEKMTFAPKRPITKAEADEVIAKITDIREAIASEKAFFKQDDAPTVVHAEAVLMGDESF
jgi:hypothetical protein